MEELKKKNDLMTTLDRSDYDLSSKEKNQMRNEHLAKYNGRLVVLAKEDTE